MQQEDQLDKFMGGIRYAESGSAAGLYTARNPSGAYGAYQFMPQYWDGWASGAGYEGASIADPAAQDAVASWLMSKYYDDYGSWDLVATAWRLGPSVAQRVKDNGWDILTEDERSKIDPYLSKVMPYVGSGPYLGPSDIYPDTTAGTKTSTVTSLIPQMINMLSQRSVVDGQRISVNDLSEATGINELASAGAGLVTDESTGASTDEVGGIASGTGGGYSTGTGSWDSGIGANHTEDSNAERLQSAAYQNVAKGTVSPVREWLNAVFKLDIGSDNQWRDLNSRPAGGAADSDHYWGGAIDIPISDMATGDLIDDLLTRHASGLGIRYTLWREENHYDHVHVSFYPPGNGFADPTEELVKMGLELSGANFNIPENAISSTAGRQQMQWVPAPLADPHRTGEGTNPSHSAMDERGEVTQPPEGGGSAIGNTVR